MGFGFGCGCDCGDPTATLTITVAYPCESCKVAGATVTISGEASGTAETDANGQVVFTVPLLVDKCVDITVEVESPTWTHAAPYSVLRRACVVFPATDTMSLTVVLDPESGRSRHSIGGVFLPATLEYSDDYGSCTLARTDSGCGSGGSTYEGSYTFVTNEGANPVACPYVYCMAGQTITVAVDVMVIIGDGTTLCDSVISGAVSRTFKTAYARAACVTSSPSRQRLTIPTSPCGLDGGSNIATLTGSLVGDIFTGSATIPAYVADGEAVPDTACEATITG